MNSFTRKHDTLHIEGRKSMWSNPQKLGTLWGAIISKYWQPFTNPLYKRHNVWWTRSQLSKQCFWPSLAHALGVPSLTPPNISGHLSRSFKSCKITQWTTASSKHGIFNSISFVVSTSDKKQQINKSRQIRTNVGWNERIQHLCAEIIAWSCINVAIVQANN